MGTRKPKKRKPSPAAPRALRRSVYLPMVLVSAVLAQAKLEERRPSDMIRVLIQRGLRASRDAGPRTPDTPT